MENAQRLIEIKPVNPPKWWHQHGRKLVVRRRDPELVVSSKATRLYVKHKPVKEGYGGPGTFLVRALIFQSPETESDCTIEMSREELLYAFGVSDGKTAEDMFLVKEYGAEAAVQGSFTRRGRYLNLPHPGTGHDGDPNLSVYLDDEIRWAILHYANRHPD